VLAGNVGGARREVREHVAYKRRLATTRHHSPLAATALL
jgi:hypothetical protein